MTDISSKEIARCGINVPLSKGADTATWPCGNTELIDELRAEVERLKAALKVHHDLGLWSLGHEICPECRQAC